MKNWLPSIYERRGISYPSLSKHVILRTVSQILEIFRIHEDAENILKKMLSNFLPNFSGFSLRFSLFSWKWFLRKYKKGKCWKNCKNMEVIVKIVSAKMWKFGKTFLHTTPPHIFFNLSNFYIHQLTQLSWIDWFGDRTLSFTSVSRYRIKHSSGIL